jgi:hypothetical protein
MTPVINPMTDTDRATELLEQARNVVERHFYELRDEELDSTQLFEMRIALQDACDTIALATRHIERVQRSVEATEEAAE